MIRLFFNFKISQNELLWVLNVRFLLGFPVKPLMNKYFGLLSCIKNEYK